MQVATSVFNMFKSFQADLFCLCPFVAKQGLSGELVTHSSQQRAKARQPPLPHAPPGSVLSSQTCTLKKTYR